MEFPQLSAESLDALVAAVARCTDTSGVPVRFYPADILCDDVLRQLPLREVLAGHPFLSDLTH